MICTFCGSRNHGTSDEYPILKEKVENLILEGVDIFYSGGYGSFDMLCLKVVGELKGKYPHIQNILVFAYLSEEHTSKYTDTLKYNNAESIYPFETKVIPRFAILKRNEWMVNQSDFVISATNFCFGGSGKTLEYAMRKKKTIIYL